MEKYAVDKENDKIEKRAREMVKTGSAVSMSEARRKSLKEDERKKRGK